MVRDYPAYTRPGIFQRRHVAAFFQRTREQSAQVFLLLLAFGLAVTGDLVAPSAGMSPMTDLSGHILNAGHFWQPATTATGHSVMASFLMAVGVRDLQVCACCVQKLS